MATVATQALSSAGAAVNYAAASASGDRFTPGSRVFMHVKNGSASSINVTITTPAAYDGLALADRVVAVPATSDRFIPLSAELYASPTDGLGDVAWSASATVTFAVLKV